MDTIHTEELRISTSSLKETAVDHIRYMNIGEMIEKILARCEVMDGFVFIRVKHTTTSLVINEDESGLIESDLPLLLTSLVPKGNYQHDRKERLLELPGEPKNARSHIMSMFCGNSSVMLDVKDSILQLGSWQAVLFLDFDALNHSERLLIIQVWGLGKD